MKSRENAPQTNVNRDLRNEVVLVTGASAGLGRALSRALAARGATVVMVARTAGPLEDAAAEIRAEGSANVHTLVRDVGLPQHSARLIADAATLANAAVTAVFQNASTLGPLPMPLLADLSPEAFRNVLETNLSGPFNIARAALGNMVLHQRGHIVFISSDAAVSAYPHWGAYGVSKAAADHLARSLAAEVGTSGVAVLAIDPGEMDTAMHKDALPDADPATLRRPAAVAAALVRNVFGASASATSSAPANGSDMVKSERPVRFALELEGGAR